MPLHVVPPYAAALAVVFVALSFRVIRGRRGDKVALGPGDASLHRRIRVHANFAEYAPFALLLLAMAELHGAWPPLLHLLCGALVAGRLAHAWGVSHEPEDFRFRVGGMITTLTVILLAAVLLLLVP